MKYEIWHESKRKKNDKRIEKKRPKVLKVEFTFCTLEEMLLIQLFFFYFKYFFFEHSQQ